MPENCKAIGVMDTDTLLFSFKCECTPKRVIDRIETQFDIFFPEKVLEELKKLSGADEYADIKADIDLYIQRKKREKRVIRAEDYKKCLDYAKHFFTSTHNAQRMYENLGDGEKHCVSLALFLSRKMKIPVMVLSDDFKARDEGFDNFVKEACFGLFRSLPEVMLFIYCTNKDIASEKMLTLVNDYFTINRPKHERMKNFKDEIISRIKSSCRTRTNWKCNIPCLTSGI